MPIQLNPLLFGVMVIVAIGTVAYNLWNYTPQTQQNNSQQNYRPTRIRDYDDHCRMVDSECAICLSQFGGKKTTTLHCNHCFHSDCIGKWISQKKTCPICRSSQNKL